MKIKFGIIILHITNGLKHKILDVGCGDGTLALYLANDTNEILGIDPFENSIIKANNRNTFSNVKFIISKFEDYLYIPVLQEIPFLHHS